MINFSLSKFKNLKPLFLVLTLVLTLPAAIFLFRPGIYYNMHDDMQMIRQLEFDKCLHDGQIPCRWTPDLGYGYGYPLFNFYPPVPYLVGQIFRTLSFNYMDSVKLMAAAQIFLASLFMYLLASSLFGRVGGLISALFYTYAPYHAVNVYVRGAFNEAWASVFFPLNLYFSKKLIDTGKTKHLLLLGLSFAFTMLSHNPMVLTFAPILVLWSLFWIFLKFKKQPQKSIPIFIRLALSAILAVILSAFFFFPVLLETNLVKINSMFEGYYHFSVHFTSIRQLFISNFWGDGASVWGQEDNMSFMIGYLHWILPLILSFFALFRIVKKKFSSIDFLVLLVSGLGFFTAFMTHERSAFIWTLLPPIQKIQFPWRFLNHTIFLVSLSAGSFSYYLSQLKQKSIYKNTLTTFLLLGLLILNLKYFTPLQYGPLTDEQKFSGKAWVNLVTSGIYDYLPKTARIAPQGPAKFPFDETEPKESTKVISSKQGTDWFLVNFNASKNTKITLAQLHFPDFKIFLNNQEIKYEIEPELGRMVIDVPAGDHQLYVKLFDTHIRKISNYISAISWISLFIYSFSRLWTKTRPSKKSKNNQPKG